MIIAVTGKIGVGKTTVASFFKKWGAAVIDADRIGHRILEQKRRELMRLFGKGILKGGRVNRNAVGDLVFSSPKDLRLLNSLVHPPMIQEIMMQRAQWKKRIAVIDAALYNELQLSKISDSVVLVRAKKEIVEKRMKGMRLNRMRLNISELQREPSTFDFLIQNNGSRKQLEEAAQLVWSSVLKRMKRELR